MDLNILALIGATLTIATPLIWAAVGEVIIERTGVLNLGIEGTMYAGAFVGFVVAHRTGAQFDAVPHHRQCIVIDVQCALPEALLFAGPPDLHPFAQPHPARLGDLQPRRHHCRRQGGRRLDAISSIGCRRRRRQAPEP